MNCCDDNGKCHGGPGCAARTCDELGVCQSRTPPCGGCITLHDTGRMPLGAVGHGPQGPFAPGVVEAYRTPFFGTRRQRRELWRLTRSVLWWLAMIAGCALAAGLIVGAHP